MGPSSFGWEEPGTKSVNNKQHLQNTYPRKHTHTPGPGRFQTTAVGERETARQVFFFFCPFWIFKLTMVAPSVGYHNTKPGSPFFHFVIPHTLRREGTPALGEQRGSHAEKLPDSVSLRFDGCSNHIYIYIYIFNHRRYLHSSYRYQAHIFVPSVSQNPPDERTRENHWVCVRVPTPL